MLRRWRLLCMLHCLLTSLTSSQMPGGLPGLNRFSDTTLQRGLQACGWTRFCSVTSQSLESVNFTSINTTCCRPCSCDESCWLFGDCCPDVPGHGAAPEDDSLNLHCHTNHIAVHGPEALVDKETNFKMITQCPSWYGRPGGMSGISTVTNANRIIQMCQQPFGMQFNISDFSFYDVTVVTGTDGLIYKNVHCASCHGIRDVTLWEIQATVCKPQIHEVFPGGVPTRSFLVDNCQLCAFPPEGDVESVASRAVCSKVFSECRENTDAELERACRFSRFPARLPRPTSAWVSNIFCLLCYAPPKTTPMLNCEHHGWRGTVFGRLEDFIRVPLHTGDTGDNGRTRSIQTPTQNTCDQGQIYDHILNVCRELVCPFGSEAIFGRCVSSEFTVVKYYMNFITKVTFVRNQYRILRNAFSDLGNAFFKTIGLPSVCEVCQSYNDYDAELRNTFYVGIAVRLTSKCTLDMIKSAIVPHKAASFYFDLEVSLVGPWMIRYSATVQIFPVNLANVTVYMPALCGGTWLGKLFDCPYIVLNASEYCMWQAMTLKSNTSMCKRSLHDNTLFEFENSTEMIYKYGELLIRMCIGKYFGTASVYDFETVEAPTIDILSLACTCLSMVCTCFAIALVLYRTRVKSFPLYVLITGMVTHVLAQGFFQFGDWPEAVYICPIIGMIIHYLWLATVFSFNTYCIAVCYTVQKRFRVVFDKRTASLIMCYILLLPITFVLINITYSYINREDPESMYGYGTRQCFIDSVLMNGVVFVLPIILCVVVNCIVYLNIVLVVRKQAVVSRMVGINRDYASVYFRMLVIAGVTWLLGFLNEFVDSLVLKYVFIIGFGGQGVFLLFAFSCVKKSHRQTE